MASRYRLENCVWELNDSCNLRCLHCGSSVSEKTKGSLSQEKCLQIADELADIGCEGVCLIGGEVTLNPFWDTVANRLIERGVRTNIITNGYGMTQGKYEQLAKARISTACVSIDGLEQSHNYLRGRGDCFEQLLDFIAKARSLGKYVTAVTTLNKLNITELGGMLKLMKRLHIRVWQLQLCSPFGRAAQHGELMPDASDAKTAYDFYIKHRACASPEIVLADNIGYYIGGKRIFGGCRAGLNVIGIDCAGNVRGCESLYDESFIEGNLTDQSLAEIWDNPNGFSYNRSFTAELLTGNCAACKHGGQCAGGCRSFNYFTNRKMYESAVCIRNLKKDG